MLGTRDAEAHRQRQIAVAAHAGDERRQMLWQAVARAGRAAERDAVEEAAGVFGRRATWASRSSGLVGVTRIDQRDAMLAGRRLQRLGLLRRQVGDDQADDARLGRPLAE